MLSVFQWSLLTFVLIAIGREVLCEDEEKHLYENLFRNYNKKVRPLKDPNDFVEVTVKLELQSIKTLTDHEQTIDVVGLLVLEWHDEHIQWEPSLYAGLEYIVVPPGDVWLPDVAIINSADAFYDSSYSTDFRIQVHNTGRMDWAFGGIFSTSCELDLTYFPFDTQTCNMTVENWAYNGLQVHLEHGGTTEILLDDYHPNGEWDLIDTAVITTSITHEVYGDIPYPRVTFEMYLERKWEYVMLNILVPCFFLVAMTVFIFLLPAESGERVSLGITILLAFSVFQLILADITPKSSNHIPTMTIYLVVIMGINTVSTLESIWVLYIHHHSTTTRPHRLVRLICFRYLAKVVFMTHLVPEVEPNGVSPTDDKVQMVEAASSESSLKKGGEEGSPGEADHFAQVQQRWKDADMDDTIANEWKCIGYIIDRIFFWVCLIIVILVTPILLGKHGSHDELPGTTESETTH